MSPPGVDSKLEDEGFASEGSESAEVGGLFDSDSEDEPVAISVPVAHILKSEQSQTAKSDTTCRLPPGFGTAFFQLEDACDNILTEDSTTRLGSLVAAIQLLSPAERCPEEDHDRDQVHGWRLYLQLLPTGLSKAGYTAADICDAILSLDIGLNAVASPSSTKNETNRSAISIYASGLSGESNLQFIRILAHLIDLPVHNSNADNDSPRKKARTDRLMPELDLDFVADSVALEIEGLLDSLCDEKAGLPLKTVAEQHAFRDATVTEVTARKAVAAKEVDRLLNHVDPAKLRSSRDRWLESAASDIGGPEVGLGKDVLAWATKVSQLWQALPASSRNEFQVAANRDRAAVMQQKRQASQLHELLEEVDVFLGSLEPCTRCHRWDPSSIAANSLAKGGFCNICDSTSWCADSCSPSSQGCIGDALLGVAPAMVN